MDQVTSNSEGGFSRRRFFSKSARGLAGTALLPLLGCSANVPSKPSILVIVGDDVGWNDVGYHNPKIRTPYIDRLAREGVELDQFYVYPTCSPTRASLLTGRPPSRFGILGPIAGRSDLALPKTTLTLPELLRRDGYDTAITGKWHLGLKPEVGPRQYGFNHTYGYLHGQIDPYTHIYKNGDPTWHRDDQLIQEKGHATDLIAGEAVKFLKTLRDKDRPFFLYVTFSVPHYPLAEDDRWVKPYAGVFVNESRRFFAAAMTHLDDAVGRILAALREEKLEQETLVIFMSDNGGQENWTPRNEYNMRYGPNDQLGDNRPLRGWKGDLYEGGIRVPAAVYWPRHLGRRKVKEVIGVGDIMPTLAGLAGAAVTSDCEGVNVWAALTGAGRIQGRVIYWSTGGQLAVRKGDWKLVHTGKTPQQGTDELFNIAEDPLEKQDLASRDRGKLNELKAEMERQFSLDQEPRSVSSR